jgi:hypothetical protein
VGHPSGFGDVRQKTPREAVLKFVADTQARKLRERTIALYEQTLLDAGTENRARVKASIYILRFTNYSCSSTGHLAASDARV